MSTLDAFLNTADRALRTLFATPPSTRATPRADPATTAPALTEPQKKLSASLMRVNHVGEVCAQALYSAQALSTRNPQLRQHFEQAAREESDHLVWTQERLRELGARPSILNPLWFAGAFGLGLLAGRISDRVSLGFVVETEHQVEEHLQSHLHRLPAEDLDSRAIVAAMKADEARHALNARDAGALELPEPVKGLMRAAAKVMTETAHHI